MRWYETAIERARLNPEPNCKHPNIVITANGGDFIRTCLGCADSRPLVLPSPEPSPVRWYLDECTDFNEGDYERLLAMMRARALT